MNAEFLVHLLPRLEYKALHDVATRDLNIQGLPEQLPPIETVQNDSVFLELLHKILLDTHIVQGSLICNKCGRQYPINNGIPNMRLNEDEV